MKKYSHIVFAIKNSRYEAERIHFKKPYGFIAPTYPFLMGMEERVLIEELCKSAQAIQLDIEVINFCGDHVHAIVRSDQYDISKPIGLWKGKTAYNFNRKINPRVINQRAVKRDGTKQSLWAKSYYQKYLETKEQITSAVNYVKTNRTKHGLPPLSPEVLDLMDKFLNLNKD
jgi:REP element-mobilizing transposase RayT